MTRIERIAKEIRGDKHAVLITSAINRRYVTGFYSSAGTVIITKENSYFLIDSRYYEKASQVVTGCKVILLDDFKKQVDIIFGKNGTETVSIENQTLTIKELTDFIEKFSYIEFDSSSWLSDILVKQRIIKTEDELKKIEAAQRIAERAYEKITTKLRAGISEKQVAALLNYIILELGADDISFPTIAASGVNSAVPHAEPSNKLLENGEFLVLDFGATLDGYHSDMTRTVSIGKPNETMKRVYDAVLGANNDAVKSIRAGVSGKLVDAVSRSTLEAWGYEKFFGHGLGHGVGLEIHEAPNLSPKSESSLHEGMVVTIEPGVYIPQNFGVRIEDMVVVTENGCINITKTPKALMWI